ncbi:GntR family transcriptional regulator [Microbacterium sp. KSW4-11]|uniref:GntR family transcriptional regulator n=1 Tax=Microbacterium gawkjiense TaxID=3067309 RepID=A0ABU3G8S5_9MICO|nr:GntR family transcriptional regulator [Microbacterium sp. KSW4-11]MDT3316214.1 GntR family transcriptional regulator [Microbacterium sp. KSW4-11]
MAASMSPEVIASRIALAIREKVIPPGAALVQEDLARRFDVSRSPVREALRILATEGVVEMTPGGGTFVRTLDRDELDELYDLRIMIEPTIAADIVTHITRAEVDALEKRAEEMASTQEISRWMRANFEFHTRLYDAARRPRTAEILRSLLAAVQPYSHENIDQLGGRGQADEEHREMIAALRNGDDDALAALFRSHLASAKNRVGQALGGDEEESDPLAPLRGSR